MMQITTVKNFYRPFPTLTKLLLFLCCIGIFTSCGSQKVIVSGLSQKEANEIIVFLAGKGIDANKAETTAAAGAGGAKVQLYDISVDPVRAIEAMALLNQAGLPRTRGQNLLEIFGNVGLVPSDLEQKIRYEAGLAEQIASTIRKIDGVLDAEVQISFPQEDPLNPGKYIGKITGSVFVKHSGILDDPNSHLITKIKRLVASSVTGLDYDNVTVIPVRARYNEIQPGTTGVLTEEEKQYVDVWSIILAKDSVMRFQIIFFSFVVIIFILLSFFVWIGWKIHPLLNQYGGFRALFHLHPLKLKETPEQKEAETKEETTAEKEETDKDVDIT